MKKMLLIIVVILLLTTCNFGDCEIVNGLSISKIKDSTNNHFSNKINNKSKISDISDLKKGDILFHASQYVVLHCLIFKQFNSTNNMYEFIEANSEHGVRRIFYSENRLNNHLIYRKFARVKTANQTQIFNAILFAESQIGKEFEWDMFFHDKSYISNDSDDPFSNGWYCTELLWAAYYNCNHTPDEKIYGKGIDIDRNEWRKDSFFWSMVWPHDIFWDDDIEIFHLRKSNINNSFNNIYFRFLMPFRFLQSINKD